MIALITIRLILIYDTVKKYPTNCPSFSSDGAQRRILLPLLPRNIAKLRTTYYTAQRDKRIVVKYNKYNASPRRKFKVVKLKVYCT